MENDSLKMIEYKSYKAGFSLGASGQPWSATIGTPSPENVDAFKEGFDNGQSLFNEWTNNKAALLGLI